VKKCVLSEDWQKYKSVKIKGSNLVKMVEAQMTVRSEVVELPSNIFMGKA
jgi:hypothetical protein